MTIVCCGLRIQFIKVTVLTIMELEDQNKIKNLSVNVILTSLKVYLFVSSNNDFFHVFTLLLGHFYFNTQIDR